MMLATLLTTLVFSAAPCSTHGVSPFTGPDNACTPGHRVVKTRRDVCDGDTNRPSLPAAERRAILGNYGVPNWSGASGEIDHRVPLVLGGTTDRRNLWPERGSIPNPKDRLEQVILRRVCVGLPHRMRVRTAVRVFLADWRAQYRYYVLGEGPRPQSG